MKSLAVKEALAPLTRLEAQAADAFRLAQQEAEIEGELLKDERIRLKGKKEGGLTREALQDLKQRRGVQRRARLAAHRAAVAVRRASARTWLVCSKATARCACSSGVMAPRRASRTSSWSS